MYKIVLALFVCIHTLSDTNIVMYWLIDEMNRKGNWFYKINYEGCQIESYSLFKKPEGVIIKLSGNFLFLVTSKRQWRYCIPVVVNRWRLMTVEAANVYDDEDDEIKAHVNGFYKELKGL